MELAGRLLQFPDSLIALGAICGLIGHLVRGSNRVFGKALGDLIEFFERLGYRQVHTATASYLRRRMLNAPKRMRDAMGVNYDAVGWRQVSKVLLIGAASVGASVWGVSVLGVSGWLLDLHPATWFLICVFLMLLIWDLTYVVKRNSRWRVAWEKICETSCVILIMVSVVILFLNWGHFWNLLDQMEKAEELDLLQFSIAMLPFFVAFVFVATFFGIALVMLLVEAIRRLARRPAADDEHDDEPWWRLTYLFFGAVPSIPLTALAFYLGDLAGSTDVVESRTQIILSNLACDAITFLVTVWVVGLVAKTGSSLFALALLAADLAVACLLAAASLYVGLLGTSAAIGPEAAFDVLFTNLAHGNPARFGTYFWSMSTALIPTLFVIASVSAVLVGKIAVDFMGLIYERATDRPLVFVGSTTAMVGGLAKILIG